MPSSSSSWKPFDSTYRTQSKPPGAPGLVQPLRFSARLRAKAGKRKRIRAQAPAPVRVSARIQEKQASKEAVHQGKEAVQQGNKARASDDESGRRRKKVQARARARYVDDDSGDESAQGLLQLPVLAAVPRCTRSSISGGSSSFQLEWGSKEPRTVKKRRRLPVEPEAMENLTYKKRKAKLPVKRKAKDNKDALHNAAAPVVVDASLPPPPAAATAAASQGEAAPLLASDASAASGAGAMQLYEQFRWIGHDDGFTPPGSPSGAHHFYAAEEQQPSELHPPPGKRMCSGLSRSGIRDGRSRDAHWHKEQQEVLLLQKHLQQQQQQQAVQQEQELQLQLTAGGDGDSREDAVRGYDELQLAVRVLPRPDDYDLDQRECWSPPWRSTPSASDAFMHALHNTDFGSAARAQLPQLYYADGGSCSTQTSSLATVDHAIAQHINLQRRPVRRSLRFEQVLETALNNRGAQQDQQLHHINGSPPEDLSCSIAPVTPQKSSQALRTPSPASPSSPPSPLLLGPCHSVTNPHDQEQQQQQGDGFCGVASPGQEGRHCLPDLNCPPDQTSTPTPHSKPRRKKYTPKVQKEKKRSVSNKPAPKPRKPRAQPPEGGQVRRAGARKSKQKQVEESQDHEQQQPLPGQEPGVMNDPDVPPLMEFAQEGDKRRNQRGASRRRTVDDWPVIVSRAQDVQDAAAAQVGSSTYPSCAHPQSVDLASFTDRTRASQTTTTLLWGNGTHHDLQQQAAPQLVGTPVPQLPDTSWPCSSPDDDDCTMEQQQQRSSVEELALATHHRVQPLCSLPTELHQTRQMQQHLLLEASGYTDDDNRLALVPHPGTKDMIVYQEPVKKKKSRPKVVLDEATLRCWNLLMGKRQPEAIDEDGIQSLKWEEERKAMKRRVARFLDRTHQVQGDHTFCIWKGSVVDSVVGAFLTQNVSDQLSSSAFMAMAARFPIGCRDGEGKGKGSDSNNDTGKDQVQASSTPHAQPVIGQQTEQSPDCSESGQPLSPQEVSQTRPPHDVNSLPNCTIQESSSMSAVESAFIISPGCGCFAKPDATSHGDDCKRYLFPQVTNEYGRSLAGGHPKALTGISLKVCLEVEPPSSDSQGFSSTLQGTPATVSSSQLEAESRIATQQLVLGTYGCGDGHTQDARGESTSSGTQWETTNTTTSLVSVGENAECCGVAGATTVMEQDREICNYADAHPLPIATAPSCASAIENSPVECGPALLEDAKKRKPRKGHSHLGGLERAHIEAKQGGSKSKTDWEAMRKEIVAQEADKSDQRGPAMDAVNWEAVRHANLKDIANVIKERGMNYMLAGRISAFLDRLRKDHKRIDLEWLRGLSPDSAKNFLLSIRGLGLKSVECIRLLTLHHRAFPVDTNVGRICVRLGWVPLEPLPEELQLHLLELYPVQATIQQYLWPRLCTLDQTTLYELHYQMITFGKVFCTKSKPNCFHCPMQKDCRHYASSSSAKLLLPGPEADADKVVTETPQLEWSGVQVPVPYSSGSQLASEGAPRDNARRFQACEPIVDMPSTPEPTPALDADRYLDYDIEDCCDYRPCMSDGRMLESTNKQLLPLTIEESISEVSEQMEGLVLHSRNSIRQSMCHGKEGTEVSALRAYSTDDSTCTSTTSPDHPEEMVSDITDQFDLRSSVVPEPVSEEDEYLRFRRELLSASSRELVVIPPEIACRPPTQLKRYGRLRTVHNVYEIPDNHPILRKVEPRDALDPYMYLLAIWGPGEGIQSPAGSSGSTSSGCIGEDSETVKGTLLIPCRTALRGIFPLNGTYFQKNEVFADHESSTEPLIVSRHLLWNLRRRLVYFGTTATNIYRNLTMEEIQACGWAACVCVRGFERGTRAPKPLAGRLHYPASKLQAQKRAAKKDSESALKLQQPESTIATRIG